MERNYSREIVGYINTRTNFNDQIRHLNISDQLVNQNLDTINRIIGLEIEGEEEIPICPFSVFAAENQFILSQESIPEEVFFKKYIKSYLKKKKI